MKTYRKRMAALLSFVMLTTLMSPTASAGALTESIITDGEIGERSVEAIDNAACEDLSDESSEYVDEFIAETNAVADAASQRTDELLVSESMDLNDTEGDVYDEYIPDDPEDEISGTYDEGENSLAAEPENISFVLTTDDVEAAEEVTNTAITDDTIQDELTESVSEEAADANVIADHSITIVALPTGGIYYASFTPAESGYYVIKSYDNNGCDPEGRILPYEHAPLDECLYVDADSEDGKNFNIGYYFEEGVTYSLAFEAEDQGTANFKVALDRYFTVHLDPNGGKMPMATHGGRYASQTLSTGEQDFTIAKLNAVSRDYRLAEVLNRLWSVEYPWDEVSSNDWSEDYFAAKSYTKFLGWSRSSDGPAIEDPTQVILHDGDTFYAIYEKRTVTKLTAESTVSVSIPSGEDESAWYSFTPSSSGPYAFYSDTDADSDPYGSVFDRYGESIVEGRNQRSSRMNTRAEGDYSGDFAWVGMLEAGTTYYLLVETSIHNYDIWGVHGVIGVTKMSPITLVSEYEKAFEEVVGEYEWVNKSTIPAYYSKNVTGIPFIYGSNDNCSFLPDRQGYRYLGWSTEQNGTVITGCDYRTIAPGSTLYMVESKQIQLFTHAMDGTFYNNSTVLDYYEDCLTFDFDSVGYQTPNCNTEGFMFAGWASSEANAIAGICLTGENTLHADADGQLHIYAVYKEPYTITLALRKLNDTAYFRMWDSDVGRYVELETVEFTLAPNKELGLYEYQYSATWPDLDYGGFDHWEDENGTVVTNDYKPSGDMKLYAVSTPPVCEHTYDAGVIQENATCTEAGVKLFTCTQCGDTYTESIPKKGHAWSSWVTSITSVASSTTGTKTRKCSRCGVSETANASMSIALSKTSYSYTGKTITPSVTVKNGTTTLVKGTDYDVTYASGRINVGKYSVKITGKGKYSGSRTLYFYITKATQPLKATVVASTLAAGNTLRITSTGAKGKLTYKSSATTIATVSTTGLIKGIKVGTVKITVTAAATTNYASISKTVTIKVTTGVTTLLTAQNLPIGIRLTWRKVTGATGYYIYRNGVKIKTITSGSTVAYSDTKAGTNGAKYTYLLVSYGATGTCPLSKSVITYKLTRPVIASVKNGIGRKLVVTWARNLKVSGYQIQYSSHKDFSTYAGVNASGYAANTTTISNRTFGVVYYVRVRSYKTVGTTKYYSAWSTIQYARILA